MERAARKRSAKPGRMAASGLPIGMPLTLPSGFARARRSLSSIRFKLSPVSSRLLRSLFPLLAAFPLHRDTAGIADLDPDQARTLLRSCYLQAEGLPGPRRATLRSYFEIAPVRRRRHHQDGHG